MGVEIYIPQSLQHLTDGEKVIEISAGDTVGECIDELIRLYPKLKDELFKDGKLRDHIEIYLNMASTYPEELMKGVKDGDKIHITTMLAGG